MLEFRNPKPQTYTRALRLGQLRGLNMHQDLVSRSLDSLLWEFCLGPVLGAEVINFVGFRVSNQAIKGW